MSLYNDGSWWNSDVCQIQVGGGEVMLALSSNTISSSGVP